MSREQLMQHTKAAARRCLSAKGYISMVDVLLEMGRLTREDHEKWRFRQVPHLERVVDGSLAKMSTIARAFREFARENQLKPSVTVYTSWGKGKRQPLRFSKYGDAKVERGYSTHFVAATPLAPLAARPPAAFPTPVPAPLVMRQPPPSAGNSVNR